MITRLLVANRGEIARRVFATCRAMGISTVAVHSDADAGAPYVAEADYAVRLPGVAPVDTYLRADLIVAAARAAGADAVHPGYGFLAENAEFAAAVSDAGLTWVGPPAKAIALMGSKIEAKALLAQAGVPMLPTHTDPALVTEFPVLVKASAGGGGRGMRVVHDPADLAEAMASARREAATAFGDGTVFCERYLQHARHIEIQVFADAHGTVLSFPERECSIQRRHQKIIEESPSSAVGDGLRTRLREAAETAARAVGYLGAGTVEFLLADGDTFHFLEMNTRLQVEHPVTECVTGVDLVRWQLLVAQGDPLPTGAGAVDERGAPAARGHAIEARLCAEDPAAGWLPATGVLHRFDLPGVGAAFTPLAGPGPRLDSGVATGSEVGVHYDSLLAKVITWAPGRAEAVRLLAATLARARLHGVTTNRDLLVRVLRHPAFVAGATDTGFLDRHPEVFRPLLDEPSDVAAAALAAALASASARRADVVSAASAHRADVVSAASARLVPPALAGVPSGWRNVPSGLQTVGYDTPGGPVEVGYRFDRTGALADCSLDGVALVAASPDRVVLEMSGVCRTYRVERAGDTVHVDGPDGAVTLIERPRFPLPAAAVPPGSLLAPLPGTVTALHVEAGARVEAGTLLLTLEAMKLEHPVHAPTAGVVAELPVPAGGPVDTGTVLAVVTPDEEPS